MHLDTVQSVQPRVYNMFSVQCEEVKCTVCSLSLVYSLQYTASEVCSIHIAVFSVQSTVFSVQCAF